MQLMPLWETARIHLLSIAVLLSACADDTVTRANLEEISLQLDSEKKILMKILRQLIASLRSGEVGLEASLEDVRKVLADLDANLLSISALALESSVCVLANPPIAEDTNPVDPRYKLPQHLANIAELMRWFEYGLNVLIEDAEDASLFASLDRFWTFLYRPFLFTMHVYYIVQNPIYYAIFYHPTHFEDDVPTSGSDKH